MIQDGALAEIFKNRWDELSGGKPIVASASLFKNVSLAGLREMLTEFAHRRKFVTPTLPEEKKLFLNHMIPVGHYILFYREQPGGIVLAVW
jgi:hypothetical protein